MRRMRKTIATPKYSPSPTSRPQRAGHKTYEKIPRWGRQDAPVGKGTSSTYTTPPTGDAVKVQE